MLSNVEKFDNSKTVKEFFYYNVLLSTPLWTCIQYHFNLNTEEKVIIIQDTLVHDFSSSLRSKQVNFTVKLSFISCSHRTLTFEGLNIMTLLDFPD